MPGIGELAVRLAELGEAEGRLAKRQTIRLAVTLLCLVVAFLMAFVGLVFLVFSLYYTLRLALPRPGALAIMGGGVLVLSSIVIVVGARISASHKRKTSGPPAAKISS